MHTTAQIDTMLPKNIDGGIEPGDLVQSAQAGSHSAFETLQKMYSRRLFKQIIAITRHHEDAEDALQEALCKAYLSLPLFERRCHIYTWLSRIAINCALMKVRKRSHLREFSLDGQDSADGERTALDFEDPGWSPEDLYSAGEKLTRISKVVESLDAVSKRILELRTEQECSIEDIAIALNASVTAVKSRLYRARHTLRTFLSEPLDPVSVHSCDFIR